MSETYDQSHLDRKYFIDTSKYNCPYCNRRSVTYLVVDKFDFNWSHNRIVYGYIVRCGSSSCGKESLHLSDYNIELNDSSFYKTLNTKETIYVKDDHDTDGFFFYHRPTTFFTLDSRINDKIRSLVSEAEGCAEMGYLVGASGCLRKAIYEFLEYEKVARQDKDNKPLDYGARIKVLKIKYPAVPQEYFNALANIQDMTSKQLHEGEWEAWTQEQFDFLVEITKEVLNEIYVKPEEKSSILQKLLALKPNGKKEDSEDGQVKTDS